MASASHWQATLQVARKELRSSFRDGQTVLYAVVLPIALYPVILWVLVQGALLVQGRDERSAVSVGLAAEAPGELPAGLPRALEVPALALAHGGAARGTDRVEVELAGEPTGRDEACAWLAAPDGPDAVLWIPARRNAGASRVRARLFHQSTERASRIARDRVLERIEPFALDLRTTEVLARGESPEVLIPFEVEVANTAPQRDMLAYVLSFLLPMLLVVMCVMGAFFPAVDLTAGEMERSTAETTLLLPVPRLAVHQGKILAVCCSAIIATGLNLTALGLSVGHLLDMLTGGAVMLSGFPLLALLSVAPLALLFSFFISAVLTGLAALARTFEEGQALLGPVQILFIVPALVGVIPGIELTLPLCFVPVVNVALAFRALLLGQVMTVEYALVALSLLFYGLIATRLAVLLLSREGVLLGSVSFRRLISAMRSSAHAS